MAAERYRDDFLTCSPWMWPLVRVGAGMSGRADFPDHDELCHLYAAHAHSEAPALRFVLDDKPRGRRASARGAAQRYDGRISLQGEVPTRAQNWHDLLNALCFATFARAKGALHRRQYFLLCQVEARLRAQSPSGPWPSARLREQDALTLFDEGGVVIALGSSRRARALETSCDPDEVADACRAGAARIVPFGHAVLEHLVLGKPPPYAGARLLAVDVPLENDDALLAAVDAGLSAALRDPNEFRAPTKDGLVVKLIGAGAQFACGGRHSGAVPCAPHPPQAPSSCTGG